jgi:AcrR family transcriptional regulator|tara:strand:+ start:7169 stop:7930 length:762 start_codon:yes stop_codon:yes gene_type:complete
MESMPSSSRKSSRRGRKRVVASLAETKTLALYREGRRLLASHDYDQMSVSQVSKAAGISVGAFYVRFKDKSAFLAFVIANSFAQSRTIFVEQANVRYVPNLADVLIAQFSNQEFAGVIRAAFKLGFVDKQHSEPFVEFLTFVSQCLAELLLADVKKAARRQRIAAFDSALAILTHAALLPDSEIDLGEIETQQIVIDLLSGTMGSSKPPAKQSRSPAKPKNKTPKSPRDPESLRKPNADKVKTSGSTRGLKKI